MKAKKVQQMMDTQISNLLTSWVPYYIFPIRTETNIAG